MLVIFDNVKLCLAPNTLSVSDTIIKDDVVYIITSKTYDSDNDELYCKVSFYDDSNISKPTLNEVLVKLYESDAFMTSGANTNNIENNPRLTMLMIVAAVVIDDNHYKANCKRYRSNAILHWGDRSLAWNSIFDDDPEIKSSNIERIKAACCELFKEYKISEETWPFTAS